LSTQLFSLLFADDTACLAADDNLENLFDFVNTELQKLAIWFKSNKLAVNVQKTKYLLFHTKQRKVDLQNHKLYFNNNDLNNDDPQLVFELDRISNDNPIPAERT